MYGRMEKGSRRYRENTEKYQCGVAEFKRSAPIVRRCLNSLRRWVFLNIWCSYMYRPIMRLLHRFNVHYCPPSGMSPEYGERNHWCQWCGLRGNTWRDNPNDPLSLRKSE